jgi:hypothetical protein
MITEGYLQVVLFKYVDESELTEREQALIRLTKEDLRDMAAPMASFANKNKYARKHGRTIIAAAESYESVVDLMIWMRRVNKIAKAHRPGTENQQQPARRRRRERRQDNGELSAQDQRPASDDGESGPGTIIFNRGAG